MVENEFIRRQYDKIADAYLQYRDMFKNVKYLDRLISLLKPGSSILDLGCGAGIPVDSCLADRGFRVAGIDISENQVRLAKKNVPKAEFKQKDMSLLRPGEYAVEAVVAFYSIFHTPRETHPVLFATINSFLPMGGLLLVTMGTSDWVGKETDFCGEEMEWSHYDADRNRDIVRQAGFALLTDEIDESGGERHLVILGRKNSDERTNG
jgi:SAM-dependent methyltransferase